MQKMKNIMLELSHLTELLLVLKEILLYHYYLNKLKHYETQIIGSIVTHLL